MNTLCHVQRPTQRLLRYACFARTYAKTQREPEDTMGYGRRRNAEWAAVECDTDASILSPRFQRSTPMRRCHTVRSARFEKGSLHAQHPTTSDHDSLHMLGRIDVPRGKRLSTRGRGIAADFVGLRRRRIYNCFSIRCITENTGTLHIPPFLRLSSALAFLADSTSGASEFSGSAVWMNGCYTTVSTKFLSACPSSHIDCVYVL